MIKVSVVGDIMCEPLLLRAAKREDGSYDFSGVFARMKERFAESDYVIGNLETPLGGAELGYTDELFAFNSPDELACAVMASGIDLVVTANNHCLDRGIEGLLHTMKVLEETGLPYTGTFRSREDRAEAAYAEAGGLKLGIVSYTYGTNYSKNRIVLDPEQQYLINLLRPQQEFYARKDPNERRSLWTRLVNRALRPLSSEKRYAVKKALHMRYNTAQADNNLIEETARPYVERMQADLRRAKEKADLVLFYPHTGGQFNAEPGSFTEYIVKKAVEAGADAVVGSHPHVVQAAKMAGSVPVFYSLGNFSMSPNSSYLLHENLPEYGLAVHFYAEQGRIVKTTFSVLKMLEPKGAMLTVWPADELEELPGTDREKLRNDVAQIVAAVTGKTTDRDARIRKEYDIPAGE